MCFSCQTKRRRNSRNRDSFPDISLDDLPPRKKAKKSLPEVALQQIASEVNIYNSMEIQTESREAIQINNIEEAITISASHSLPSDTTEPKGLVEEGPVNGNCTTQEGQPVMEQVTVESLLTEHQQE